MNNEAMKEVLNELFSHLERLEAQNEAILKFLKEKKRVTDKQLAPYLEEAGNAANVKWRAARVRIDHLLEPEHPEKEAKLGKRPELHEESSSVEKRSGSDVKDDKQVGSDNEESKRARSGDQKKIETSDADLSKKEKPAPAVQARSVDSKKDQPEDKSGPKPRNIEQTTQEQQEQKSESDGLHHPTESEQQGAERPAQLKPEKTSSGKEAA